MPNVSKLSFLVDASSSEWLKRVTLPSLSSLTVYSEERSYRYNDRSPGLLDMLNALMDRSECGPQLEEFSFDADATVEDALLRILDKAPNLQSLTLYRNNPKLSEYVLRQMSYNPPPEFYSDEEDSDEDNWDLFNYQAKKPVPKCRRKAGTITRNLAKLQVCVTITSLNHVLDTIESRVAATPGTTRRLSHVVVHIAQDYGSDVRQDGPPEVTPSQVERIEALKGAGLDIGIRMSEFW
jgi:hypothetical protein